MSANGLVPVPLLVQSSKPPQHLHFGDADRTHTEHLYMLSQKQGLG